MSTVERAYQAILTRMLRGELQPGTWLRQDELAAQLGVSKIPIREALQRLSASGLLRIEPQRGAVIPSLSRDDAEEIFHLRKAIEPMLLQRAVEKLSIVDLARAEHALRNDSLTTSESNWQFHRALYRPAGWFQGMGMAEILHASVAPYIKLYTAELEGEDDSDRQHEKILQHCRERRTAAACGVLQEHLDQASTRLGDFLESSRRAPSEAP